MINFNSIKTVYVITDGNNCSRGVIAAINILGTSKARDKEKSVSEIPTNEYVVKENDSNHNLMEGLRPLVGEIEKQYKTAVDRELNNSTVEGIPTEGKIDPKIVFLIDTSNKTSAALAHLFQGPWGGFPFAAKYTLAMDLSVEGSK